MQSQQRQIKFKRLALQWELRRVPPGPSEKDQALKATVVVTYTLLLEDPFYPETVLAQRRFTLSFTELQEKTKDALSRIIDDLEATIKKSSPEKGSLVTSISYTQLGLDEQHSGNFSITSQSNAQTKDSQVLSNADFSQTDAQKIRAGLSETDDFFYRNVIERVRDENSRAGIKLDGI